MRTQIKYICIVFSILCLIIIGGVVSMADESLSVFYVENSDKTYKSAIKDSVFATQIHTNGEVEKFEVYIADFSANGKPSFIAQIYKWNRNYATSLKSSPIVDVKLDNIVKGNWAEIPCVSGEQKNLPAGEYLIIFKDAEANVKLEVALPAKENVRMYMNSAVCGGNLKLRAQYKEGEDKKLSSLSDNYNEFITDTDTWIATDGLGRDVGISMEDTKREGKYVGIFFHTWHTHNAPSSTRNITNILKEHPEIVNDFSSKLWGNAGAYFWNEPIWGYYQTNDEWVLRKQAELLADAQIDVVFFDCTNGDRTFVNEVHVLMKVWAQARADGVKTPQICFMLPMFDYNYVAVQLREIYREIYSKELYKDLWFYWKGKPLVIGYPGELNLSDPTDAEIFNFFNYRVINHAQSQDSVQVQSPDGKPIVMGAIQQEIKDNYILWNWISTYPQLVNKNPDGTPEQVAVAIAHNWCAETHLTAMNNPDYDVFGRHYSAKKGGYDTRENAKLYGAYFSEQWEYALDIDPEIVFVTGWNEWVAGRFEDFLGVQNAFPDNFSDEYSRDIEPSTGDLKDHYYYQLVQYVRKFKGVNKVIPVNEKNTIDIYASDDQWANVGKEYKAYRGDTFDRDARGYRDNETGKWFKYEDQSGRNDIIGAKVAHDDEFIYFMVETAENITPYTDKAWMRLLIDVESVDGKKTSLENWETFNYIINRNILSSDKTTTLESSLGGWNWENVGEIDYYVSGRRLQVKIPKKMLGIESNQFTINFKWSDNMQSDGDIMDFYTHGDAAPEGRFKYRYMSGYVPAEQGGKNIFGAIKIIAASLSIAALAAVGTVLVYKNRKKNKGKNTKV